MTSAEGVREARCLQAVCKHMVPQTTA